MSGLMLPTMPATTCPHCHAPNPRKMPVLSEAAYDMDYFRCIDCGHVWTVTKDGARLVSHVTIEHTPHSPNHK